MTTDLIKKIVDSFGGWKRSYITLIIVLFVIYFVYKIWINVVLYLIIIGLVLLYLNERKKNKSKGKSVK
jgi:hypothetical protein